MKSEQLEIKANLKLNTSKFKQRLELIDDNVCLWLGGYKPCHNHFVDKLLRAFNCIYWLIRRLLVRLLNRKHSIYYPD